MAEIGMAVFSKVIEKPIDLLWNSISNPVTAVFSCKKNVENLKKEVVELKKKLQSVKEYEQYVERTGEEMANDPKTWLTDTERLISETDRVFPVDQVNAENKCFFGVCFNPVSRYKLSKKAAQNSVSIAQQLTKATGFSIPGSYAPAPVGEVASAVKGFEEFGSRRGVLEQIMKELQSTRVRKVALYGMAGAGKTMLVKELKRKAEEEKLFEKVVFASVTNNPDLRRIQKEIACGLGMDQLPAGLEVRDIASRINAKLRKLKTVLVIFDDVWTKLNLEELGVAAFHEMNSDGYGGEGMKPKNLSSSDTGSSGKEGVNWKILFTSRDLNVLKTKMSSEKEFEIGKLAEDEARQMFKKIAGERVESDRGIRVIANGIVEKCDGLPLAISALANALKGKDLHAWSSALSSLRNPSPNNFIGMNQSVYAAIEVSYDQLETDELKKILLLSSMLSKYTTIQYLLMYGAGLGLLSQTNSIREKRDKLLTLISDLKAASLLIDSYDDEHFAMHDLVRDVAVSIAQRNHCGLLLKDDYVPDEWRDVEAVKNFEWISVEKATVDGYPFGEENSQLRLLLVESPKDTPLEISTNFFEGMQRLKVLDMTCMNLSPLPSSICLLKSLQTLCLDWSELGDMSMIGELKSLEILSLSGSDFEELPREVGQLTRLKLLDLSSCDKLQVIPPATLKHLSRLEELYMGNNFDQWELEEHCNQRNASLVELKYLKSLAILEVKIGDVEMIPRDLIFNNLTRYTILIGDAGNNWKSSFHNSRILRLNLHKDRALKLDHSVNKLLFKNTEELHLEGLNGVRNLVDELDEDGFKDLKYFFVRNSLDVEKIINSARNALPNLEVLSLHQLIKLEKIFQGRFTETSFLKLREIDVSYCDQLKNLFSSAVAKHLPGLQEIRVTDCKNMEEILDDKQQGSNAEIVDITERAGKLEFGRQLRVLLLKHLPKLSSFNSSGSITLFNDQVVLPNLVELKLSWIDVSGAIWETNMISSTCVENLTKLIIEGCHNLRYIFTSTIARGLLKLAHLEIKECRRMGEVVLTEIAEEGKNLIFPKLSFLLMEDLQSLVGFYSGTCNVEFPTLKQLHILNCPKLKRFSINSGGGDDIDHTLFNDRVEFPKLTRLRIESMGSLTMIWDSQLDEYSFSQLNYLNVELCEKLLHIFPFNMMERLKRLDKLQIWNCDLVEKIFESQGQHTSQSQANRQTSVETPMKFVFPSLTNLHLHNLPNLKCFFPQELIVEFPILTNVEVNGCDQVQILASEYASFQQRLNKEKQVEVRSECHLFLVTKDTFSSLEELIVKNNRLMENIWRGPDQVDYLGEEKGDIFFTKLKYLELNNLHGLGSFCSSNCKFGFPSLKDMIVMGCPRMKFFSVGESQTPKLQIVKWMTDGDQGVWKGDLNATIQELFAQKVGYSTLEYLKLVEFPELIRIWNKAPEDILLVRLLKRLEVCNISSLRRLFTLSMALDLVHLENLKVINCNTMEEVIAKEGSQEIIFPKLKVLWLEDLPRLARFYSEHYVKFPSLWELAIERCHLLQTFVSSTEKENYTHLLALFDVKVEFPKLTRLRIESMGSLTMIWDSQLDEYSFSQLNYLNVELCEKLLHIFPFSMMERLKRLDKLQIWNCDLVEKIFESQGQHASQSQANQRTSVETPMKFVFPSLTNLHLHNLPNLKCFFPQELIVEFPILTNLEVNGCDQVQIFASEYASFQQRSNKEKQLEVRIESHLFSVTKDTFSSLEELIVKNNHLMEDIWRGPNQADYLGEEKGEIFFTKLKYLELNNLHGLGSFCSSNCKFSFPSLEDMIIMGCPRMKSFTVGESQTPKLQIVKWMTDGDQGLWKGDLNATVQEFFAQKVGYSTLEHLKLVEFPELISIWNKTPQDILSVRLLKRLEVCNISSLRCLFTPSMALDLVHLENLKVINCETMEEVITKEGSQEIIFPKLKVLWLEDLPKLARFYSEHHVKFPSLRKFAIVRCHLLKTFISSTEKENDTHLPALFDVKVALPKLEVLIIDSMGSLNKIWEDQLEADAFCELNYLRVKSCEKLLNIFPYGMLERLQKLDKVGIRNCNSLEEIFEYQGHGTTEPQTQRTTTQPIVVDDMEFTFKFPNLTYLALYMLPKLKYVFPQVHTVEFPLLEELEVSGCDTVQTFASAFPSFQSTLGDDRREVSILCPLFWVTEGTFPSLITLELGWDNDMMDLWCGQDPGSHFPKLKRVVLIHFPEQSAQLPFHFFQSLSDFRELVVNGVSREISQEDKATASQEGNGHVGGSDHDSEINVDGSEDPKATI